MAKSTHYNYFSGFAACADCACRAAALLDETVREFNPETVNKRMSEIHAIEHEADSLKHTALEHLAREFLPPIERSDISTLHNELDNVVDGIDEVPRLLSMFRVKQLRPDTARFTELLTRCTGVLNEVVHEFCNFKKSKALKEKIILVNTLETEGDTLHFEAVDKLFCSPEDALSVIVWKNVYDCFESCFDACEHVADVIEEVILANS
ncbi:MAG TPA: DUF47 family protein [Clostridia bacterium]|nr:DUF47 family protein [Clostridia bacterium]